MDNNNQSVIEKLNRLLAIAKYAEEGYEIAAGYMKNVILKNLFLRFSHEREVYVKQLEQLIYKLNGKAETKTDLTSTTNTAWEKVKFDSNMDTPNALIYACIAADETAVNEYRLVLQDKQLSETAKQIIGGQLCDIERTVLSIKSQVPTMKMKIAY